MEQLKNIMKFLNTIELEVKKLDKNSNITLQMVKTLIILATYDELNASELSRQLHASISQGGKIIVKLENYKLVQSRYTAEGKMVNLNANGRNILQKGLQ